MARERRAEASGVCTCGRVRLSYVDGWPPNAEDWREPERCPQCGRLVPVIVVRFLSRRVDRVAATA